MLEVLKHRQEKDNNDCMCGRREPAGLTYHKTGWYCYQCFQRLTTTEYKLMGYEDNPGPTKETVIATLLPDPFSGVNINIGVPTPTQPAWPSSTPVWTAQIGPQKRRR